MSGNEAGMDDWSQSVCSCLPVCLVDDFAGFFFLCWSSFIHSMNMY